MGSNRRVFQTLVLGLACVAVGGCGMGYRENIKYVVEPYKVGHFEEAAENARRIEKDSSDRDRLVMVLEEGASLKAAGREADSNKAYDKADQIFDDIDSGAKVSVSQETAGVVFSPAAMTYRGYGYDRIMIHIHKALSYMELGKPDAVRTEIVNLASAQQACQKRYEKQIAELHKKQQENAGSVDSDMDKVQNSPHYQDSQSLIFAEYKDDPELKDVTPISNESYKAVYANAFGEYLKGVFYEYSKSPGEAELARVAFRNTASMVSRNKYIGRDVIDAEKAADFKAIAPKTYVFFETGMAPERKEIRIDIPVFLVNIAVTDTKVDYVGIAFPMLHRDNNYHEWLNVSAGGQTEHTELLADIDKIVAREFQHELPIIITRLVISAGVKVAAQYATAEAVRGQSPLVQIAARGANVVFDAATNEADLRTWRTLPKQVQLAAFETPADGVVRLSYPDGREAGVAKVTPGKPNVIWVRSASRVENATIRSFSLN